MNRIVIGSNSNDTNDLIKDELVMRIDKDTNVLIEDSPIKKIVFDVEDASVNILIIRNKNEAVMYDVNVNKGNVSFNNISYDSNNVTINVNLNQERSNILLNNSVVTNKEVAYDINVNHNAMETNSNVCNNGVTKKDGTIKFNVSSYAPKGSKDCNINQDSKIITLNKTNNNEIKPILLIDEFETEAKHAAFIGNFKASELFYLQSRGLTNKQAKNLLINGMLIGNLDVCFNEKETLKKRLNEEWR